MSYSFVVKAATKAEAYDACVVKMEEEVSRQPVHAADRDQALANAKAAIELLPEDATRDVTVSMNGYVSGVWDYSTGKPELVRLEGVSISVNVGLITRPQAA